MARDIPSDIGEYLQYNPTSGLLTWKKRVSSLSRVQIGSEAGSQAPNKGKTYRRICFRGADYFSHRIAWFLYYGEQPPEILDHINRESTDNRIQNLRSATHQENMINSKSRDNGLPRYVRKTGKRFQARVTRNGTSQYIGTFDTPGEAHSAALEWVAG